jgi:dTDP-4-amino-4,6-dideoxygalactose transaminase
MQVSRDTGVPVVEDCSHAHGATWKGKPIGGLGHVGCWSLQGSKPVSGGEAGVMATNDVEVFERACLLGQVNRLGGVDLVTERYEAYQPYGLGMKLRAHPLGVGIAAVQLKKLEALNARRGGYVAAIESALEDIPGLKPVKVYEGAVRGGYYAFPVHHLPEEHGGLTTPEFVKALQDEGLPAGLNAYPLLHLLPLFARGIDLFTGNRGPLCGDYPGHRRGDFPISEKMHDRLMFLPVLSNPKPGAAEQVIRIIDKVARRYA